MRAAILLTVLLSACALEDDPEVGSTEAALTGASCGSRDSDRQRLLDQYAAERDLTGHDIWNATMLPQSLSPVQKAVFLTVTDLLGSRTYLPIGAYDTALSHVNRIVAIVGNGCPWNDPDCECGGPNAHRIFFEADGLLMEMFRARGMRTYWDETHDKKLYPPFEPNYHEPFNDTLEYTTKLSHPLSPIYASGQIHFWRTEADAATQPLVPRTGVTPEQLRNPNIVEIDIDYTSDHDSNPLCGSSAASYAEKVASKGCAEPVDLAWQPAGPPVAPCVTDPTGCGCPEQSICCQGVCAADECHGHGGACGSVDVCGHKFGDDCASWASCVAGGTGMGCACDPFKCDEYCYSLGATGGSCEADNACHCCEPTTCGAQGAACGWVADGCGGSLDCGGCPEGWACNAQHQCECVAVVINPPSCGPYQDSCGNPRDAGGCPDGFSCNSGTCTQVCYVLNPPSCGWYQDSCGNWLYAGDCPPCGDWNYDCYDDCTWEYTCGGGGWCEGTWSNEDGYWYSCWDWAWYCYLGGWNWDYYGCLQAAECCEDYI